MFEKDEWSLIPTHGIALPLVGSDKEYNLVNLALMISRKIGTNITILHVRGDKEQEKGYELLKAYFLEKAKKMIFTPIKFVDDLEGDPREILVNHFKNSKYDLILMNSVNLKFPKILFGSTTKEVLNNVNIPVMVLFPNKSDLDFKRIMTTISDMEDDPGEEFLIRLATIMKESAYTADSVEPTSLHAVGVVKIPDTIPLNYAYELIEEKEEIIMNKIAEYIEQSMVDINPKIMLGHDCVESLMQAAQKENATILFVDSKFLGSGLLTISPKINRLVGQLPINVIISCFKNE